tara:strand:+ start:109 stop:261 length:153 start_codon:yes stop_codon:yes gene_type:complete
MKKEKKVKKVRNNPYHREDPAKILKRLNLDTKPEWTFSLFGNIVIKKDKK